MDTVFTYVPGTSFLHRMNALVTFISAFLLCVAAAVSTNVFFVLALIAAQLVAAMSAKVFRKCLKIVVGLGSLALIVLVLQVLFVRTGSVYMQAGPLLVTHDGLYSGVLVVLKVICMVLPLSLAFMVQPINALTDELVSKCRLPYKYAFTITTAIRFIPLLMEEMSGIMEAQKARGVQFDTGNILKRFSLMVPVTVPLLVSSVKKVDAIAIGAELRGFSLRGRASSSRVRPVSPLDIAVAVACVAILAAALAINVL